MNIAERAANDAKALTWLQSLTVGGVVCIKDRSRFGGCGYVPARVARLTATQVVILSNTERRFRLKDGKEVAAHSYASIIPMTKSIEASIQAEKNRSEFSGLTYRPADVSDAEIAAMLAARASHLAGRSADADIATLLEALEKIVARTEAFIEDDMHMQTHSLEVLHGIAVAAIKKAKGGV